MTRQEHEQVVRTKIISVARRLFLEQGYQNTKIRQISETAEVKTGSIYHFYKNKEDIFANIVREAFFRVLRRTLELSGEDKLLHLATEIAWHVYTMAHNAHSAELYLISYNSPGIAAEILANQTQRSQDLFGERIPSMEARDHRVFAILAKGMMQSITLLAVSNDLGDIHHLIHTCIRHLLKVTNTPQEEIDRTLATLDDLNIEQHVLASLAG